MFVQKLYKWLQNVFNSYMYRTLVFSFRRTKNTKNHQNRLYIKAFSKKLLQYPDLETS